MAQQHSAYPPDPYKQNVQANYPPPPQPAFPLNAHTSQQGQGYGGYAQVPQQGAPYGGYGHGQQGAPYGGYGHAQQGQQNQRFETREPLSVPKASDDKPVFSSSFSDKAIRRAFIRKVYLILFAQLLVTFGFVCLFVFVNPIKNWVQDDGRWFYYLAYALFIVLYIALACCSNVRRKTPLNFICLAVFTLAFSYMAGAISSYHDTNIVLIAAGITAILCLAISIFAIQTKIDFTMCSGLIFVLFIVVVLFGFACMITAFTWGTSRILSCVYSSLVALLFGVLLVFDTQQVMGGRKHELSPEEYIYGALQLYVDVVYIFLAVLGIAGSSK